MAVLILNPGASQIVLPCQRGGKSEPIDIGEATRAFLGNERTSIRAQKRVVPIVSAPVDATVEAAVVGLFAKRAQVPCTGDVFNNAGAVVVCSAKIASEMLQGVTLWVLTFTLTEV